MSQGVIAGFDTVPLSTLPETVDADQGHSSISLPDQGHGRVLQAGQLKDLATVLGMQF